MGLLSVAHTFAAASNPQPITLNRPTHRFQNAQEPELGAGQISQELRQKALRLKANYYAKRQFDYAKLASSQVFQDYLKTSYRLTELSLETLSSPQEQIAFWMNVYNGLTIHGILDRKLYLSEQGLGDDKAREHFFETTRYEIGGYVFSLNDIEHGILRSNRPTRYRSPQFSDQDPRRRFAISSKDFDPRIHFALNCGSKSCPPVAFFDASTLDKDLAQACQSFVRQELTLSTDGVRLPELFDWYDVDFTPDVRSFLARHATTQITKALRENVPLKYQPFDWSLNGL